MLIFDNFDSREDAEKFVKAVKEKYNRKAFIYDTREAFNVVDIFPQVLFPPIVRVERPISDNHTLEIETEIAIEEMVKDFNGEFAGT
jgi:hypothetical protein